MWSDEFDNKFRGLHGSQHEPGFDEAAWDKMEKILDIHLPQKKKKRRGFIFWIILAGLGLFIPAVILLTGNKENTLARTSPAVPAHESPQAQQQTSSSIVNPSTTDIAPQHQTTTITEPPLTRRTADAAPISTKEASTVVNANISLISNIDSRHLSAGERNKRTGNKVRNKADHSRHSRNKPSLPNSSKADPAAMPSFADTQVQDLAAIPPADAKQLETSRAIDTVTIDSVKEKLNVINTDTLTAAKKKTPANPSRFAITASVGPDVSSVGISNAGSARIQFGAGFSYDITSRISLRTGFYAVRKVYNADSADYHPPDHFWNYYPNLQGIHANCLVFEIPVTVAYHFKPVKKHNWFVAGGVSSIIMKEETYGYSYKNASGQPAYYKSTYKNENKHLFSIINLSAGYQASVSKRFSILAEPYFKLPVTGIGFGKIRLSSYGILFTAAYSPFVKKIKN